MILKELLEKYGDRQAEFALDEYNNICGLSIEGKIYKPTNIHIGCINDTINLTGQCAHFLDSVVDNMQYIIDNFEFSDLYTKGKYEERFKNIYYQKERLWELVDFMVRQRSIGAYNKE